MKTEIMTLKEMKAALVHVECGFGLMVSGMRNDELEIDGDLYKLEMKIRRHCEKAYDMISEATKIIEQRKGGI